MENWGKSKDVLAHSIDQGGALGYCWPSGFWADYNYWVDTPMILNPKNPNFNFDQKVRAFYEGVVESISHETTTQIMRPFGCDLSHVDSGLNYKINDKLIQMWNELGFNKDIELRYSTPTKYMAEVS